MRHLYKFLIILIIVVSVVFVLYLFFGSKKATAPKNGDVVDKESGSSSVSISQTSLAVSSKPSGTDMIKVDSPISGEKIVSPLTITGEARGSWYFEGSFPVVLEDSDGNVVSEGYAAAEGEWMTVDYVPFKSVIEFTKPNSTEGKLILKKDNPSDLRELDDEIVIVVTF